jgi:MraZ protein
MFLGHYQTNFNIEKGRTSVPKTLHEQLGREAVITKGYEGSLIIVKKEDWEDVINQVTGQSFLSGLARQTDRFLLGNAFEVKFDAQGRFVIPPKLREYAKLGKEVIFVGIGNRIEIWDKETWEKNDQYLNENIDKISETLNDKLANNK